MHAFVLLFITNSAFYLINYQSYFNLYRIYAGLQYHNNFQTTGKPDILQFIRLILDTWQSIEAAQRPRLLWREETPSHYPTDNGWWTSTWLTDCQKINCTKKCVFLKTPHDKKLLTGTQQNNNNSLLEHANAVNTCVKPLLEKLQVPIADVFQDLLMMPHLHGGNINPKDCTHWNIDGNMYLNEQILKAMVHAVVV
jgi:hypothetical protein